MSTDTYQSDGRFISSATMSMKVMNQVTKFDILTSGNWSKTENKLTITLESADLRSASSGENELRATPRSDLETLINSQFEENGKDPQIFEIANLTEKTLTLGSSIENPDMMCTR